jgi:hypothetical protein
VKGSQWCRVKDRETGENNQRGRVDMGDGGALEGEGQQEKEGKPEVKGS